MTTITVPEIGTKVRAKYIPSVTNGRDPEQDKFYTDQIVTVDKVDNEHYHNDRDGNGVHAPVIYAEFVRPGDLTGKVTFFVSEWEVVSDIETAVEEEDPKVILIGQLRDKITLLESEITRVRNNGHRAMNVIAKRINEEAESRGWCEQFDAIIDELNEDLDQYGLQLEKREQEFEITITTYVTITETVNVTASDYDSACEAATDQSDLADAFRYGNYDVTDVEYESS